MTVPTNQPPEEAASHSYPEQPAHLPVSGPPEPSPIQPVPAMPGYPAPGQSDYMNPGSPIQTGPPVAPPAIPGAPTSGAPFYTAPSVPMQRSTAEAGYQAGYQGQVGPPQGFPVAGGPVPNPVSIGPGPGLVPEGAPPGTPGARRGRVGMVLTAVLLVVVLGLAGWFVAYKIDADETIKAKDKRIEKLQSDLKDQGDELKTTKDSLTKSENELEDSYKCADAANDLLAARDEKSAERAVEQMLKEC